MIADVLDPNKYDCEPDGHVFEDHPTVCSECGESCDRAELVDFMDYD